MVTEKLWLEPQREERDALFIRDIKILFEGIGN